jgi:hypothetical protein
MRNEQFGALLIQLQGTVISVRSSLSASARWSFSLDQDHSLVQRRGLVEGCLNSISEFSPSLKENITRHLYIDQLLNAVYGNNRGLQ